MLANRTTGLQEESRDHSPPPFGPINTVADLERILADHPLDCNGVAALTGRHPSGVRKAATDGALPGIKIGSHWRFSAQNVATWLGIG
jgi:excisionase family DNA binding protein